MFEREEIIRPPRDVKADRQQLRGLAQAALKAEHVTSDPAWDTFTSYIARALEVAHQQREAQLAALASPNLVNPDKIVAARNSVFLLDERIRSLQWVISMPAEIKKVGSVAKEKLAAMEVAEGDGNESNGQ